MKDSTEPPDRSSDEPGEPLPLTRRARREARSRPGRRDAAAQKTPQEEPSEDAEELHAAESSEGGDPDGGDSEDAVLEDGDPEDTILEDAAPEGGDSAEGPEDLEPSGAQEAARPDPRRPKLLPFLLAGGAVVLITLALLWWFLLRDEPAEQAQTVAEREDDPGIDGVILRDAEPDQWLTGDCLTGFQAQDESGPATIIECEHSYDVQVIRWEDLEVDEYPSDEGIAEQAQMICEDNGQLDQDAVDAVDFELQVRISHPTESTWDREDDRRVNCLLQPTDGTPMTGNFVEDPEEHSSADDDDDPEDTDDTEDTDDDAEDTDPEDSDE